MTVNVYGFQRSLTEDKWALRAHYAERHAWHEGVWSGLTVSAGSGLSVSVAAGDAFVPGLLVQSTSSVSVPLTAGTGTRVDYLILEANWGTATSALGTAPHSAAFKVKTGTANTPPALTQTAGSLWQMPLARLTPGGTGITTAGIEACYPRRRRDLPYDAPVWAERTIGVNQNPILTTATLDDPGWPYRIRVEADVRVSGTSGYGVMHVLVNGVAFADKFTEPLTSAGRSVGTLVSTGSEVFTGPKSVNLRLDSTASTITVYGGVIQGLHVEQIPA